MSNPTAQQIVGFIRRCVEAAEADDDTAIDVRAHFRDRMRERGLFWSDVVGVLWDCRRIDVRGLDDEDRLQVWVWGDVRAVGEIRIVCSIDFDLRLITLNWGQP